ncbi:hypothetical protein KPL70_001228 [Citrus sinensis]|nr:hypothetical protein KPL70_001228 [Citrus sinensis]
MKKSLAHRLFLKKRLYTFSMREWISIQEHIDNFNKIILDLEGIENVKITNEDKAFFLLSSLPKIYEGFVDTMLYGRTTLTLEDVKASLSFKEIQKNKGHEDSNGEGLFARTDKKNKKNKNKSQAKKDDASAKEKMKKRKCFYCKKQGHYIRDCTEKKKDEKKRTGDAAVASDESYDDGYYSADLLVASNSNIKGQWVLDSGCLFHLCPDKSLFHTYESVEGGRVLMGNNNVCKIVGMWSVKIEMFDRTVKTLCDVRHAPRLKRNLISLDMLDSMRYCFKYENGGLKIIKGTEMIMKGVKKNGLYVLEWSSVPVSAVMPAVSDVDRTMLWHLRLSHMSIRGIQELSKQGLLCGDRIDELDFCENCIFDKAHRSKFPKGMHISKQPLDYVHADLWGLAQVPSLSGGRYFISVIDDYSRKVWIYILKTKDQAWKKFKIWKTLVETQSDFKVKCLRTDNGLELCNKEFEQCCQKWGIRRHKTVRFTFQENGLAKRMNRTFIDKTRCLRINSKLPRSFWAEAVSTASYLVNKSPSATIGFKTPEELWFGKPGRYKHLRDLCIEAKKCLISRDVQFNEVAMINNLDQVTSAIDINTSDTQATVEIDQGEKIEVELSNAYEDKIQPEAIEAESQDAEGTGRLGMANFSGPDPDPDKPGLSGTGSTRTGCINNADPGCNFSNPDIFWVRSGFRFISESGSVNFHPGPEPETLNPDPDPDFAIPKEDCQLLIRILLAMVALFDLELEQMDVKTAYLHGNLEEKILMSQPEGFEEKKHEGYVCLLQKSLYGLKQSPRQWYRRFDQFMISNGYYRRNYDSCVYHEIIISGGAVYLLLYVDNILIAGKNLSDIKKLKNLLKGEFEMKDLGSAKRILGIDIVRDRAVGTLFLSQSRYISKVLERFQMIHSKPVLTPLGAQFKLSDDMSPTSDAEEVQMADIPYSQAVGSLMYAMVCTRADIAYVVSVVSRFMSNLGKLH